MPSRITVFRAIAVAILLLTGVELVACELMSPASCEITGIPGDGGTSPAPEGQAPEGDSCLCCCFHIVVSPQIELTPTVDSAPTFVLTQCNPPSADAPHIYHPPRV
jgi:hypothetical protein